MELQFVNTHCLLNLNQNVKFFHLHCVRTRNVAKHALTKNFFVKDHYEVSIVLYSFILNIYIVLQRHQSGLKSGGSWIRCEIWGHGSRHEKFLISSEKISIS